MPKEKFKDLAVGGQAVFEGVMMRTPNAVAIAVRDPRKKIHVEAFPYKSLIQKYKFLNIPIVRGVINLFEMTKLGTHAINYSVEIGLDEKPKEDASTFENIFHSFMQVLSFIFSLFLALFLFKYLPLLVSELTSDYLSSVENNYILFNTVDALFKVLIFATYVLLLNLSKSLRRVFQFHGAEHMAVHAYEKDLNLTIQNVKKQTTLHPRCGTSFIVFIFLLSVIFYTLIPKNPDFWTNLILRISMLPVLIGVSYEILKLAGKNIQSKLFKVISVPGLLFQKLTTKKPKKDQIEVAIRAINECLTLENEIQSKNKN